MHLDVNDKACLWDMLDAARTILGFIEGRNFTEYLSNRMLRNAVERNLEIIGEAAKSVSEPVRSAYPQIPWKSIIAQRNVLAHEYGEIRHERLWLVCTRDIPQLIQTVERMGVEESAGEIE